jgi:hypothetical protein
MDGSSDSLFENPEKPQIPIRTAGFVAQSQTKYLHNTNQM